MRHGCLDHASGYPILGFAFIAWLGAPHVWASPGRQSVSAMNQRRTTLEDKACGCRTERSGGGDRSEWRWAPERRAMNTVQDEYCYLILVSGPRAGTSFTLEAELTNHLGRGTDCEVSVSDPNCSRVHAQIVRQQDGWWLRDLESRNGSYLNDQRTEHGRLRDGDQLRFGETVFTFHLTNEPPTLTAARTNSKAKMVVQESPVDARDSSEILLKALENAEFAHDLLIVYQLSMMLLEYSEPEPVIRTSLEVLHERTHAAVVGFLWVTDDGQLRPSMVLPDRGEDISLNETLSGIVSEQARAVWISNHTESPKENSLRKYSDAICVPLVRDKATLGVLHLYLKNGRFRRSDFDLAISVANLMTVALVRTRKDMTLKADHRRLANEVADSARLLGESPPMQELKSKLKRIGQARGAVLIRGESGAGKELVARALHAAGPRRDRPLLSVNCAAIPADLIESQLFGHCKGAFTGAERDHVGWFQQADTGTLFLDEVGELPLEGQAKLLRILEGHPFLPVGGTEEISVDVRVIAATNRDLREFVRRRQFRQDLYFRLSVFELDVPPLRERGDDIRLLVRHFFDHFRRQHGRMNLKLSDTALAKLVEYDWPGNVRQLRNVIDSAVVLADANTIQADDLGIQSITVSDRPATLKISEWERRLIQDALARTRGKVPDAAKLLGIGRATLYRKIEEYQIDR